jgi:hypothetical protein
MARATRWPKPPAKSGRRDDSPAFLGLHGGLGGVVDGLLLALPQSEAGSSRVGPNARVSAATGSRAPVARGAPHNCRIRTTGGPGRTARPAAAGCDDSRAAARPTEAPVSSRAAGRAAFRRTPTTGAPRRSAPAAEADPYAGTARGPGKKHQRPSDPRASHARFASGENAQPATNRPGRTHPNVHRPSGRGPEHRSAPGQQPGRTCGRTGPRLSRLGALEGARSKPNHRRADTAPGSAASSLTSTRRFCLRPSRVRLSATGASLP